MHTTGMWKEIRDTRCYTVLAYIKKKKKNIMRTPLTAKEET